MKFPRSLRLLAGGWSLAATLALSLPAAATPVHTQGGDVEGLTGADPSVRIFLGIPFAAPPVGELRWKAPQPVAPWTGVRAATHFGARAMQAPIYSDMIFRDDGPSEDCLYLNVWTPARAAGEKRPVMVWIYGGGFQAGAASEPRQDGEALAKKGVVVVSLNYRLGVFGFLAHPELTAESGHASSGNYGLLDQIAGLRWVRDNIAAFGGDPANVTIFGESAGSMSVSALMSSRLARGLFQKAIGESGALFRFPDPRQPANTSLAAAEQRGVAFAAAVGAKSLAELRARPADEILKAATSNRSLAMRPVFDGYVLPVDPLQAWERGEQAHVPLLAGWNADEVRVYNTFGDHRPTAQSFIAETREQFGDHADAVLKLYPAPTDAEAVRSAGDLACDRFIVYSTWRWLELQVQAGDVPVYRFSFDRAVPVAPGTVINGAPATGADVGAVHASEITYVFGSQPLLRQIPWQPEDGTLSDTMGTYWTNFAKTGNPNGDGLPRWPRYTATDAYPVMHLDTTVEAKPEAHRARYEFWSAQADAAK